MGTECGYIKSYRSIMDKSWYTKSEYFHLWHHLLFCATHKALKVYFNGADIILKPGQLITGRKTLSKETGINEAKVHRILLYFEKIEHQIEQRTTNTSRLITIINWDKWQMNGQQNEQPVNNKRTTDEQQMNTNKKDKNEEEVLRRRKKEYVYSDFYDSEIVKSEQNENYIKVVKILHGENNLCLPLESVLKMETQLSFEQFQKIWYLKEKYKFNITDILESMEDWKDIKKRKTVYKTFLTFLKNNNPSIKVG